MRAGIDATRPRGTRALLLTAAAALSACTTMSPVTDDYSQRLDALWSFDHPAASEALFREEVAHQRPGSREADEASTQIARAEGLQRRFDAADSTLDAVADRLDAQPPRVRVRYLLERGRRENSSGHADAALAWFERALAAAGSDRLPGADYYRIDALHMLAIASPPARQLDWNLQALAAADAATDPRARRWRGSLLNNLGWTMHERGDFAAALAYWQQALAAREATGDIPGIRIARWTVARGMRSLGRLDDAESIQRTLAVELDAAGASDGFVFEELAEIALARGDPAAAQPWAAKALAILGEDPDLRANDAARLARLAEIAKPGAAR